MGVNSAECFARKNCGEGSRSEARRRRTVQLLMKGKVEDAMVVLKWSKESFSRKMGKVERRWGHHRATMIAFRAILTREAVRVWNDGKDKNRRKIEHLEAKWGSKQRREVEGLWREIRIGDRELEEEEMGDEEVKEPNKFGGATTNAYEDALLALPHKFTTFESIKIDKIKVSTEILKDKIRWDLRKKTFSLNNSCNL